MKKITLLFILFCFTFIAKASITYKDSIGLAYRNGNKFIVHQIAAGETLRQIARKYKTTVVNIVLQNTDLDSNYVKVGQKLYIPTIQKKAVVNTNKATLHTVKSGENLTKIALFYKKDIDSILLWNQLDKNTPLQLGQSLVVGYGEAKQVFTETMLAHIDKKKVQHSIGKGEKIPSEVNSKGKFALHRSFPIGAMILLVNPTNRITTEVKVIGRIPATDINKEVLIKVSEAVCKELMIVNNRFPIEILYEEK
jgi:LysM repeat protein